jgi:hypothetical protein
MTDWTDEELLKLDERYAQEGVHPHQRPFRAALDLLKPSFQISPGFLDNFAKDDVAEIMNAYRRLIPEIESNWPGFGIGIVASIDRVRRVTLGVMFGEGMITAWKELGFASPEEWIEWCRNDHEIARRSEFTFADIWDFAYGFDQLRHSNADAEQLWKMAQSNLEDVANALPSSFSVNSILQPIILVAELSLKACLAFNGVPESIRKKEYGHDAAKLFDKVKEIAPHRDDAFIDEFIRKMPSYVNSRYSPHGLTRLHVVELALAAQFVAASTVRRISGSDLAAEMEADAKVPGRPTLFTTA